jgi:autoinducer 2-degrading protein
MVVTTVMVQVDPQHIHDFIDITVKNHEASVKEPGNMRFDILQSDNDPSRFVLYEAYENEAAALEHKKTAHYQLWRDTVAPWMVEPRKGIKYKAIRP